MSSLSQCENPGGEEDEGEDDTNMMEEEVDKSLHIKGQMNFMPDWNVVMFLCSPAIANLEQLQVVAIAIAVMIVIAITIANVDHLQAAGLFICDLSMHDFSRDLLLASRSSSLSHKGLVIICLCSQQSNELKDALESENEKTKQMEERKKQENLIFPRSNCQSTGEYGKAGR